MQRTDLSINNIDNSVVDIISEFKFMSLNEVRIAIRNGSLGLYGRSYKLDTQEICIWIRKYLETKKPKLL